MATYQIQHGENLNELPLLACCSVDSVVTDPPYELGFMGKGWDRSGIAYNVDVWRECLRVLKPGGHLLAFGGSRTYHRLACAIEDAGFEIRDQIQWIYGSGFPKSLDVSKAIDTAAGAERSVAGEYKWPDGKTRNTESHQTRRNGIYGDIKTDGLNDRSLTVPATDAAKQWNGWGTALKPAHEPIVLARKPLIGTVAENVLQHGTGGLNIDECRIGTFNDGAARSNTPGSGRMKAGGSPIGTFERSSPSELLDENKGRWPANVIHNGSEEVLAGFPDADGATSNGKRLGNGFAGNYGEMPQVASFNDSGSAARFFYCAKASQEDREAGLEDAQRRQRDESRKEGNVGGDNPRNRGLALRANHHPTVKPTDLMRYLCRLVTPPNGTVLDPFCGSGSSGRGAILEGLNFIGIEKEAEYCEIAKRRIESVTMQGQLTFA